MKSNRPGPGPGNREFPIPVSSRHLQKSWEKGTGMLCIDLVSRLLRREHLRRDFCAATYAPGDLCAATFAPGDLCAATFAPP